MRGGEGERALIATREQFGFAPVVSPVNGADGVDDVARSEIAAARYHCFACRQALLKLRAPNLAALFQNPRAARNVNRAVNAAAAEQGRVRGVDNGINVLARDVVNENDEGLIHQAEIHLLQTTRRAP